MIDQVAGKGISIEEVVGEFLPVIKHLAFKLTKGFDDQKNIIDDVVSAGIVGLLEAIEKYDAGRGTKLNTFAYLRIRGAMTDELRLRDWFPRSARTGNKKIEEAKKRLKQKLGGLPNDEEMAAEMGISLKKYLTMAAKFGQISVLSVEDISETLGVGREIVSRYLIDTGLSPEEKAFFSLLEEDLAKEIEKLKEKQKIILSLHYKEDMNIKEIAEVLDITGARVCQIHKAAILALRKKFRQKGKPIVVKDILDSSFGGKKRPSGKKIIIPRRGFSEREVNIAANLINAEVKRRGTIIQDIVSLLKKTKEASFSEWVAYRIIGFFEKAGIIRKITRAEVPLEKIASGKNSKSFYRIETEEGRVDFNPWNYLTMAEPKISRGIYARRVKG